MSAKKKQKKETKSPVQSLLKDHEGSITVRQFLFSSADTWQAEKKKKKATKKKQCHGKDSEAMIMKSWSVTVFQHNWKFWQMFGFWKNTAFLAKVLLVLITEESELF